MGARVPVARRNIFSDRRRLRTGVFGVGVSIALIFLLQGLWGGFQVQLAAYAENAGVQLFVGDRGTRTSWESSVVPLAAVDQLRAIADVRRADPISSRTTILTLHGRKVFATLVGYEPGGLGGPWRITEGRSVRGTGEAVIDRTLARQHGITAGGSVQVQGERFRVVGLSAGTRTWMSAYVFVSRAAAAALFKTPETANFVLVRTSRPDAVAARIARGQGLGALTVPQLVENDRRLIAGIMAGPIELMVLIAFVAGTLVVALTVYAQVVERAREYGIIKAMGAGRRRLFAIVLEQTFVLAAFGLVAGSALFWVGGWAVVWLRPQFSLSLSGAQIGQVAGAAVLMALIAAVVPTRRIARLDPASVYRG